MRATIPLLVVLMCTPRLYADNAYALRLKGISHFEIEANTTGGTERIGLLQTTLRLEVEKALRDAHVPIAAADQDGPKLRITVNATSEDTEGYTAYSVAVEVIDSVRPVDRPDQIFTAVIWGDGCIGSAGVNSGRAERMLKMALQYVGLFISDYRQANP